MHTRSKSARPRTRAVIVTLLIALGVVASVGVGQAAESAGPNGGGTVCADGRKDTNPADGVCTRDGGKKDGAGKKDEGKKDAPPPDPNIVAGTPCTKTAHACADLGAKKAWLISDGKVTRGPVPIAHGGPGYETPRGTFQVQWKHRDHRSAEFDNAPMPFSVFFTDGGIAFHQGDLNSNSHGCIRLGREDAEAFFNTLAVGDEVQVR